MRCFGGVSLLILAPVLLLAACATRVEPVPVPPVVAVVPAEQTRTFAEPTTPSVPTVPRQRAPKALEIQGKLSLPPGTKPPVRSETVVELRDVSAPDGAVVAEVRTPLQSAQAATPFTLVVDRNTLRAGASYAVQGAILEGAGATWVTRAVPVDPQAAQVDVGELLLEPFQVMAFASTLRCGPQYVTLGFQDDRMLLKVGGRTLELKQAASAEGILFVAAGDPSTRVLTEGDTTTLTLKGRTYPVCVLAGEAPKNSKRPAAAVP